MRFVVWLCLLVLFPLTACVHTIHVNPLPSEPATARIPRAAQVIVGRLSIEGADHRPGITLLEWPHRDLAQAIIEYVQRRETFSSVSATPADLALSIGTKLAMKSRERYRYSIQLQAEMRESSGPVKTYVVERDAEGSTVRWVTASDRDPIEKALQLALDDLLTQVEGDRSLYMPDTARPGKGR